MNKLDDVATSFEDIYERLPRQLNELINAPKYKMKNLTEGTIKKVFGEDSLPIEGVFLISNHTHNDGFEETV